MAKFLFFIDSHIKGINPRNRIDNYQESIYNKFKEIIQIAKHHKVNYVVCGGDLFDSPNISLRVAQQIINLFQDNSIILYIIWGNHDLNHCQKEGTVLDYTLNCSPWVKHVNELNIIDGYDYHFGIEQTLKDKGLTGKNRIAVIHANILKNPGHPNMPHIVYKDLKTDYDLILIGHYHPEHGIVEYKGTKFAWIGGLSRGSIDSSDLNRIPQVAIINTTNLEIETIKLNSALPVEEIFNLAKIEGEQEYNKKLDSVIQGLQDINFKSFLVTERLKELESQIKPGVWKLIEDKIQMIGE